MSTNSYIGALTDAGEVGYYCHSDGYPAWMGAQLQQIVARDGYELVAQTLLGQRQGWLQIDIDVTGTRHLGDRAAVIDGYGLSYRDSHDQPPIPLANLFNDPFIEFAYFVQPDNTIAVYEFLGDGTALRWVIGEPDGLSDHSRAVRLTRDMVTRERASAV